MTKPTTLTCSHCKQTKPSCDFGRNSRSQNGKHTYCRTCVNDYYSKRYHKKCMDAKRDNQNRTQSMNIDEIKAFITWCRENGVYHIELKDTLVADIAFKDPEQPKQYTPTNLDYIPTFSPDFVQTPFEVEEVKE